MEENEAPEATQSQDTGTNEPIEDVTSPTPEPPAEQAPAAEKQAPASEDFLLPDGSKLSKADMEKRMSEWSKLEEIKKGYQREFTKKTMALADEKKRYAEVSMNVRRLERLAKDNPDVRKALTEYLDKAGKLYPDVDDQDEARTPQMPAEIKEMVAERRLDKFFKGGALEDKPEYRKAIMDKVDELAESYGVELPHDLVAKLVMYDHLSNSLRVSKQPAKPGPGGKPPVAPAVAPKDSQPIPVFGSNEWRESFERRFLGK